MSINKYLIAFTFIFSSFLSFAQQETHAENKIVGNQLLSKMQSQEVLFIKDPKFEDITKQDVFTSINPNISIHFGFNDDKVNKTEYQKIYSCKIILSVNPYDNTDQKIPLKNETGNSISSYEITLNIKHDNVSKGLKFDDYAVYTIPGVHKASVEIKSISYYNDNGPITVNNSSAYLQLKFSTDRYYNLQLSSTESTNVLPLEHKFIKYDGTTSNQVNNVSESADEILITWRNDTKAPALEYELEWTWIDNFAANGGTLSPNQILLSDQDFKLNSTRIQTKDTVYRIPIVYSKGYIVYRVRPVGRFLDNISKNYYGNWTSGFAESHKYLSDWSHFLVIDENHELGKKNWQYQSSFAEDGKKKEVVSYFDGSLRNRQTVTKINSNNKAVVGEVIYDNQGRAAIEVLPVPVESSGIRFYSDLNKNNQGTAIYTHNDFDWEKENEKLCIPSPIEGMSNTSGASKYYSSNNSTQSNHQDLVPDAALRPFSQIEYTPDNTGRIKRKGGVGKDHQIGSDHEMRYFYGSPDQEQLNRLFGYKVGNAIHYKKNIVIDPNGQISVSYLDPQGRTVATALAGDKRGNLLSLEDELDQTLHQQLSKNLIDKNYRYASGNNNIIQDGFRLSNVVEVVKKGSITFNYDFTKTIGSYNDSCLTNKYYPFVYDWSISMTDDCANELLLGVNGAKLTDQIGKADTSSYVQTALSSNKKLEGKTLTKDNTYDFINEGKFNLTKTLQVNTDALNKYADDYITELKNGTTCKPVLTEFETPVLATDCNVTCRSCEEALVTSNLEGDSAIASYKATLPTDESTLGDITLRESFIKQAETKYAAVNLPDITLSNDELVQYTNHFKAEFRALLENCRELCQKPINICSINEQVLLADVSPNGQYGSVAGLEEAPQEDNTTPPTEPEVDGDSLSVFSENNQLLYGGYNDDTETDPDNPNVSVDIKVAKANWRYPVGGYRDENGEPFFISIVKNEDGTYTPPLRYLDNKEPDPTKDDLTNDDDNIRLVGPEYLANVSDFLAIWQSSWAKALLPHHPEYQYYLYNKAICEKTVNGENSDGFDEKLRDLEYLNQETGLVENNVFSTSDGMIFKILNSSGTIDPFYNGLHAAETDQEYNYRKNIMLEGLGSYSSASQSGNFDGMTFKNSQGVVVKMNMLQTAYYFAAYSNGITPVTAYQNILNKSNNNLLADIAALPDNYLKQRIWSNFKSYYIALKEKTRTVFSHIYANKKHMNNSCIGDEKNTDSYVTLLKKYTANYAAVTSLIDETLNAAPIKPTEADGILPICTDETAPYYANKVKRFVPADQTYDSGLSDTEAMASAKAKADANLFLETGKCPLGLDMEMFLKGLTDTTIQPRGVLVNTPASSMPYLTEGIFKAQINPGFDINASTAVPRVIGREDRNNLNISFHLTENATDSIATSIVLKFVSFDPSNQNNSYKDACGNSIAKPRWQDIVGFKNFHYLSYEPASKTFKFRILATIVRKGTTPLCITPEEVIIEGYTKAAVGECHFSGGSGVGEVIAFEDNQCNKKNLFGKALRDLVLNLQRTGTSNLTTSQIITNNDAFKSGYLKSYFGITTADVVKWNYEEVSGERFFSITVNDIVRMKLNGGSTSTSIGTIKDLFIADLKADGKSNILRVVTRRSTGIIHRTDTKSWGISAGKNNALYFACCAPCGEDDFDGDGYGDKCGDPAGIIACELIAQEEQNYEENLKNALNAIISNPPSGNQSSSNNITIRNFISGSNLIQHFQALRNYQRVLNPTAVNYVVDLANYSSYIGPDGITLKFANSNFAHEAEIKLTIPNANQIKTINSIDYINETTLKVKYTTVTNQIYIVQNNVKLTNAIALNGIQMGYASSFCEFMSDEFTFPKVISCKMLVNDKYANDEEIFENGAKEVLNEIIKTHSLGYSGEFNNNLILNKLIIDSKLINRFQVSRNWVINNPQFSSYPDKFTTPIELKKAYLTYNNNLIQIVLKNDNNVNEAIITFSFPNIDDIAIINSIDYISGDLIRIQYTTKNGQVITSNTNSYLLRAVQINRSGVAMLELCNFLSYFGNDPTTLKFSKSIASSLASKSIILDSLCNDICVPPTVSPVVCGDKWNEFKTGLQAQMPTYEIPKKLKDNGQFFCEANFGYISKDYLAYLVKFNVKTIQDPLFLTIADFGSTRLKYGNDETPNVINAYYTYIQSQNPNVNPDVSDENSVEVKNWKLFADEYVVAHSICSPATMVPGFSLEIPAKDGDKTPCEIYKEAINKTNSQQIADAFYADKKEEFKRNYLNAALDGITENLTQNASDKEYQYTLYYYDQAGNLVQTVPPQGVKRLSPASDTAINNIRKTNPEKEDTAQVNGVPVSPLHTLQTQYRYNSLNQLVWQQTPDGHETTFAYDALGRIIASQNAKQKLQSQFSYTRYDALGRITEAGQLHTKTGLLLTINKNGRLVDAQDNDIKVDAVKDNYPYNIADASEQVTKTIYDNPLPDTQNWFTAYGSDNSHKRVTGVLYFDTFSSSSPISGYTNGIFYDYDVHGNVKELVHHINNSRGLNLMNNTTKKVVYDYDLISGNVNKVTYQPNSEKDQFIHRYEYDADNRIQQVYTSKDNIIWEKEANYLYYDHGPLARVEIGDKQVQGLDYIYTLQGWLKGVNSERIGTEYDAGKDGLNVAQDAFAFALNYYTGDYKSRSGARDASIFSYSADPSLEKQNTSLYNGNIKEMVTSLVDNTGTPLATQYNYYKYDQLNRIKEMTSKSIKGLTPSKSYESSYSYDRNGNLKTLFNTAPLAGHAEPVAMDQLTYHYNAGTNQLRRVNDAVDKGVFTNGAADDTSLDIDNQYDKENASNTDYENYEYDKIGQLTRDKQEGIDIEWRVDGKVKSVTKNNGTVISFEYDGLGNRIAKIVATPAKTTTTFYQRDAQGNVLSTYEMIQTGNQVTYDLIEQDIYGSSRLGIEKGRKSISAATLTAALRKSAVSSKLLASVEPMAAMVNTTSEPTPQFGLNVNAVNSSASWIEKPENSINLFANGVTQTEKILMSAHLKIDPNDPANKTGLIAALHGTSRTGSSWPGKGSYSYISSVLLSVEKSDTGYMPVVSLIKYKRNHHKYKKKGNTRYSFRSYQTTKTYKIISPDIPENEWDIQAIIKQSNSNTDDYNVTIILNGNEYQTKGVLTPQYNGEEIDNKKGGDEILKTVLPPNSIGQAVTSNHQTSPVTYNALKSEICDFSYTVNNGQEPEDVLANEYSFDEQTETGNALSINGAPMVLKNLKRSAGFCGTKEGDRDGDGWIDKIDNCPNIFNPGQEDDDGDGVGNVCDNCKYPNPLQIDKDQDGRGDGDKPGDLGCDNCPEKPNYDQIDTDNDGVGDVCDNCRFKANPLQEDVNQNGIGDICEGIAQGEGENAVLGTPLIAYRFIGDKQYELSNHLGNVLSVISDRVLFKTGNQASNEVLDTYDFTGWTSIADGNNKWVRSGATVTADGNKLIMTANQPSGVLYTMMTTAGKKYTISYDLDLVASTGVRVRASNFSTTITQKTDNTSGRQTFSFIAQGVVTTIDWYRTKSRDDVNEIFSLDNVTISGESTENSVASTTFVPDVLSYSDYYPFGMLVPDPKKPKSEYSYGFNGKELDDELKGEGNSYDFGSRVVYDPRLARFISLDPRMRDFPHMSPYAYAANNPIYYEDHEGEGPIPFRFKEYLKRDSWYVTGFLAGLGDGVIETLDMAAGSAQASAAWTPWTPYAWTESASKARAEHREMGQMVIKLFSDDGLRDKMYANIKKELGVYFDQVTGKGTNAEMGYQHGKLVFDVLTMFIGVGELKALVKTGEFSSNALNLLRKSKKQLIRMLKPCGCFTAGTQVYTEEGYKNIEDVKVGDKVWAYNDKTDVLELKEVIETFSRDFTQVYKIHFGNEVLEATNEHPFFIGGKWLKVDELKVGDSLTLYDGATTPITKIEFAEGNFKVYNFTVDEFHTYYVSKQNVLVHNGNPCSFNINWKGFSSTIKDGLTSLQRHFIKHGAEFGENVTQNQYLKMAKDFAKETKDTFIEVVEGNFLIKYDSESGRVLVAHIKDRQIRTFYKDDGRSADALGDAVELAKNLSNKKP